MFFLVLCLVLFKTWKENLKRTWIHPPKTLQISFKCSLTTRNSGPLPWMNYVLSFYFSHPRLCIYLHTQIPGCRKQMIFFFFPPHGYVGKQRALQWVSHSLQPTICFGGFFIPRWIELPHSLKKKNYSIIFCCGLIHSLFPYWWIFRRFPFLSFSLSVLFCFLGWGGGREEVTTMPLVKIPSGLEVESGFYVMYQMAAAVVCFASYISFLRLPWRITTNLKA